MSERAVNVLFLCTGNSARSVIAEAILSSAGSGRFRAFSAGSHPLGKVNSLAVALLQRQALSTGDLRSKSWDEFAAPGAPRMDLVITVCNNAAGEACPIWPGHPVTAHWDIEDPAAVKGTDEEKRRAFAAAFESLQRRISLLVGLPLGKLDAKALRRELDGIERLCKGER